jgi:eukaryotic-like serine/threonine-protein kinase
MASVYRARDDLLKRDVAVKLIAERFADDPPFVERFRREARLCARLAHPNILAVLDAGDEPRDFIVTELVDELDAGRLLQRHGRLTPGQNVHVVVQVCEALQYAHEHGVVHCDLAPRTSCSAAPTVQRSSPTSGLHPRPSTSRRRERKRRWERRATSLPRAA